MLSFLLCLFPYIDIINDLLSSFLPKRISKSSGLIIHNSGLEWSSCHQYRNLITHPVVLQPSSPNLPLVLRVGQRESADGRHQDIWIRLFPWNLFLREPFTHPDSSIGNSHYILVLPWAWFMSRKQITFLFHAHE